MLLTNKNTQHESKIVNDIKSRFCIFTKTQTTIFCIKISLRISTLTYIFDNLIPDKSLVIVSLNVCQVLAINLKRDVFCVNN